MTLKLLGGIFGPEHVRLHGKWEAGDLTLGGIPVEAKLRSPRTYSFAPIYQWVDSTESGLLLFRNDRRPNLVATYLDNLLPISKILGRLGEETDEGG